MSLIWKLIKYFLKYFIRFIQITIFLIMVSATLYSIYLLVFKVGYPASKDILSINLKGDLLINGIPVITIFLLIFVSFIFLLILMIPIYLCCILLMIINGSLGDLIEYINVTGKYNYPYYLVFEEGKLGIIFRNKRATRHRFLLRWRTYF